MEYNERDALLSIRIHPLLNTPTATIPNGHRRPSFCATRLFTFLISNRKIRRIRHKSDQSDGMAGRPAVLAVLACLCLAVSAQFRQGDVVGLAYKHSSFQVGFCLHLSFVLRVIGSMGGWKRRRHRAHDSALLASCTCPLRRPARHRTKCASLSC